MHKFRLRQAVVPAHSGPELKHTCEIVGLLPVKVDEEPQYRIRERDSGIERTVSEREIKPLFGEPEHALQSV